MSKSSSSIFFICVLLFFIVVQECHGVKKVQLQDRVLGSVFTPFDEDGNVDYTVIPKLAQYYHDNNIKVIYAVAYYGAGASLPLAERKRVVKAWEEQTNCLGMDLVVEVGALPFVDTLEMARYCTELNVTAITAFPEIVYQATTTTEALEDLQRICDAIENKLSLLYHQIIVVDTKIRTEEVFLGAYNGCVSCFCGVITSVNTFLDIKAAVPSIADYLIIDYGVAAIAASFKVGMNATEIICLFPELILKIKDAVDNCQLDLAADLQQELNRRTYAITNVNGGVLAQTTRSHFEQSKAGFELLTGIPVGYRYPLERPNSTVINKIKSNLQRLKVPLYSSDNKN